jgi:hypothetical protein
MSTNSECLFFRWSTGWFYTLEDWNSPAGSFDWCEEANSFGPFKRLAEAEEHLRRNHANPGSSYHTEDPDEGDPVLVKLVANAMSG